MCDTNNEHLEQAIKKKHPPWYNEQAASHFQSVAVEGLFREDHFQSNLILKSKEMRLDQYRKLLPPT